MQHALGYHVLIEFYKCDPRALEDVGRIEKILLRAAKESKAKVVASSFHQFEPFGVSGVIVIEESHYTIHTWPEYGYAAVDLFFCDPKVDVERAIEVIKEELNSQYFTAVEMKRGTFVNEKLLISAYDRKENEAHISYQ